MNKSKRQELYQDVDSIINHYCEGCFLHSHLKLEKGRRFAHRFCISQCTVGEKIQDFGKRLAK